MECPKPFCRPQNSRDPRSYCAWNHQRVGATWGEIEETDPSSSLDLDARLIGELSLYQREKKLSLEETPLLCALYNIRPGSSWSDNFQQVESGTSNWPVPCGPSKRAPEILKPKVKGGKKKSVSWPVEEQEKQIRYFEKSDQPPEAEEEAIQIQKDLEFLTLCSEHGLVEFD